MSNDYSFGVPGWAVWSFHIIFGIFLAYIGYQILMNPKFTISRNIALLFVIIGVMAILYHSHLAYIAK